AQWRHGAPGRGRLPLDERPGRQRHQYRRHQGSRRRNRGRHHVPRGRVLLRGGRLQGCEVRAEGRGVYRRDLSGRDSRFGQGSPEGRAAVERIQGAEGLPLPHHHAHRPDRQGRSTRAATSKRVAMSGPLTDLTIVEFAGLGPGPYAAMLLADMGATVIRIERPDAQPPRATAISQRGRAKRYAADLKNPEDLACVRKLVSGADALIEGFRPGTMERLGLGPEVLIADNPRLVYGRVTGWGTTRPLLAHAGHDKHHLAPQR